MPTALLRKAVGPIPGRPLPYGLISAASAVVPVSDEHELNGVEFPLFGCGTAHDTTWCPPGETPVPNKTFNRLEWGDANPVAIYYGSECSTLGFSFEDAQEDAREGLLLGEQRALEEWFMQEVLAPQAVNITPTGGPVPIAQSIGLLEGELASTYGGQGVLHVPAGVAAVAAADVQFAETVDGARHSWLGNRFALGGGYQVNVGPPETPGGDPTPAPAGHVWLYATGPILIRRQSQPMVIPQTLAGGVDMTDNNRYQIAERISVIQYACAAYATLATINCCC